MLNRVLFVSTYNYMTKIVKKISKKLGFDVDIYEGGIVKNGHLYAEKHQNSYDIIISQGGTASVIKSLVSIPVISIELETVDILTTLYTASNHDSKIGLVVPKSESLTRLDGIKEIINIDFTVFIYSSKEEFRVQVNRAINSGVSTLIGTGDCIIEAGKHYKLNSFVVPSQELKIEEALLTAKNICDLNKKEEKRAKSSQMIIDYSGDGIIALDNKNIIVTFNPIAQNIFNLKSSQVIDKSIYDCIDKSLIPIFYEDKEMQLNKLIKMNNKQFIMNRLPIIYENELFSVIITFQEVTKLQDLEQKIRKQLSKKGLISKYTFDDIIGESEAIKYSINQAKLFAKTDTTVLITAETGTGKELFAQSIHNFSQRSNGPFVAINCAALPKNLLESELFGYEEGAFTGAKKGGKPGLFELAHGGTIFLDEVSEIPLSLQGRLLRILQEKEVLRIGGDYILNVDVRVIAATNANLFEMVKNGEFRQDLYFRLNILDLRIPPLSERKNDIPYLLAHFIEKINNKHGTNILSASENAIKILKSYSWPGNIRQLESFTEKMCILSNSSFINGELVNELLYNNSNYGTISDSEMNPYLDGHIVVKLGSLKDIEKQVIKQANEIYEGDKTTLAEKLGISRTTLWKKLNEYD